jgi:geranylgeranyl pyrophosphate synthase
VGERFVRALEIVRDPQSLAAARDAVAAEVDRAHALAERLPEGPALTALVQLADFLAARCGVSRDEG